MICLQKIKSLFTKTHKKFISQKKKEVYFHRKGDITELNAVFREKKYTFRADVWKW